MKLSISIVVPVYAEAKNLRLLHERLQEVTSAQDEFSWSYIFVNDGSPDDSLEVLRDLATEDAKVVVLDLSRNFGKEIALTAGVHAADTADAVICIDADLQHPPELIPTLIQKWQAGAEIVATVRSSTDQEPLLRKLGSRAYYWIMSKVSGLDMVSQTTDFRLYDKKVVAAFKQATERDRMFRGIMDWLGFHKVYVEFEADARNEGEAGYSYSKLWQLAISSITSFSLWPLRLAGFLGVIITSTSSLLLLWMLLNFMFSTSLNYTPLAIFVVANTFFMGVVLISIGLVALYIGNIHTEVINRPLYLIREKLGGDPSISPGDRAEAAHIDLAP
jgi:dolichol-phosphate mannosyltransferase